MEKFYYMCEVGFYFQGQIFNLKFQHISCLNFNCSSLSFESNLTNEEFFTSDVLFFDYNYLGSKSRKYCPFCENIGFYS